MKTKQIFSLVLTVLVLSGSLVFAQAKKDSNKVVFDVNMHCEACQKKIEKNIAFEKGVKAMEVSLDNKTVALTYDSKKTSPEKLQAALVKLGYTASVNIGSKECCDAAKEGCCKEKAADCKAKAAGCDAKAAGCDAKAADCKAKAAGCDAKATDCKAKAAGCDAKTAVAPKAGCCTAGKAA